MDKRELEITAELAFLELKEDEMAELGVAVEEMLGCFAAMNELDVSGLPPTTHSLLANNRLREDVARRGEADGLLERAPEIEDRLIVIPNVL